MNPLTTALYAGIAVVVLGAASWIVADTLRLKADAAEISNLTTQAKAAQSDNATGLATIAAQQTALATWADSAAAQVAATQAAAAALHVEQAARAKSEAALSLLEAKDRSLPACTKLLAVDLAAVCPSHAQALQERSK